MSRQKIVDQIEITRQSDNLYSIHRNGVQELEIDGPLTENYIKREKLKRADKNSTLEGNYTKTSIQEITRFIQYNGEIWRVWDIEYYDKYPWRRVSEKEATYVLINFGKTIRLKQEELFKEV